MGRTVRVVSSAAAAGEEKKSLMLYVNKIARLALVWGLALMLSLALIVIVYALFVGRDYTAVNQTLYDGRLVAGEAGRANFHTDEGRGLTTYGDNGQIVNKAVRDDAFRIVFQGDSYLKSAQVSDAGKFTEIVETTWNDAHPSLPVQTLNLGMEGLDMRAYLSFAGNIDDAYAPDMVVLMLSMNDFRPVANNPELLQKVETLDLAEPLLPTLSDSTLKKVTNDLGLRSFMRQIKKQLDGFSQQGGGAVEETAVNDALSPDAVRIQLQALQALWGDRLVIFYHVWIPDLGEGAPATHHDFVMDEMEALGIPYVTLYEPFQQAFANHTPPNGFNNSLLGHGHWNQYGHQLAAEVVLNYLETAVLQEAAE